ncbi:hypothetical protein MSG28_015410 [Choristoneura fumiferana]|uniref:Uncharacterized protein n=1 Tax=Choristoneura fumiferana TaxID=7141 RepID=A0ACC0KA70_CHOFU|nr:hypothetical protein MSG28_015410 [Choristoneura fumiferana]
MPWTGPGLIDELEAYMAPVGDYPPDRRLGYGTWNHQLPESPPDSGSEHPYSPESQAHIVSQTVLGPDYVLVHDHMPPHELIQPGGDYMYEELKSDNLEHEVLRNNLSDVVVMPQDGMDLGIRTVRHDLGLDPIAYQNRYNQMRVDLPELDHAISPQLVSLGHEPLTPVYTNLQEPSSKKRKHSQDVSQVKCEPAALSPETSHARPAPPPSVDGSEAGDDAPLQCIRFSAFQQTTWHALYDCNLKPLQPPSYVVGADKGFNFSQIDEAFVCQKKNHFQVTCQIQMQGDPHYVKTSEGFKKINNFRLHFYGVKAEDPSQEVRVEQSQSDRTKKPFHPVPRITDWDWRQLPPRAPERRDGAAAGVLTLEPPAWSEERRRASGRGAELLQDRSCCSTRSDRVELRREGTKVTVGRLHFAETTNNNMRKKGRPNPDQRHFQLVVALRAHVPSGDVMVAASASDRIIVRFESDCTENWWQRGVSDNSVHFNGRVGINTDRPDESCVINGNLKVMGHIVHPSDARAKHNIEELDTAQQLKNVQSIRVVKFNYDPSFAEHSGLLGFDPTSAAPQADTGVIAQEVRKVLPEAVKEAGDVTLPNGDTIHNLNSGVNALLHGFDPTSVAIQADTGVIAQEVGMVLPEAVKEAGDVTLPNGDTIHKFLVVKKDRIFMENLGAVKELCRVTGNLESRIDHLERVNRKLCKISILQRRDSARSNVSSESHFSAISSSSKSFYSDGNISIDQIRDIARNIRKHECCHKLSHNSPKYTRKQCKNCHDPRNYSKYGKFYNYNKTCVRYHTNKEEKHECNFPSYVGTVDSEMQKISDEYSTMSKKKDTCLWLKDEDNFACGNSKLAFCCRKKEYSDASSELISNKFLQIVITILIFIMAVCLVVMSALYFREHQELLNMKESRQHEKYNTYYNNYKKLENMAYRATPPDLNQIQNLKPSQHAPSKKTKEKGTHKTTQEFTTTSSTESPHTTATTLHASKNYVLNVLNMDASTPAPLDRPLAVLRSAELFGSACAFAANADNELDAECQSSCSLDPPQGYETQEPLERIKQDLNDTFVRPLEPHLDPHEKLPSIPIIPEKNNSETLKQENESFKTRLHEEMMAESNLLDPNKMNLTDNLSGRVRRNVRRKRETNEALSKSSSEEMVLNDQSYEMGQPENLITFGVATKSFTNNSLFTEIVSTHAPYNFTYAVPLSHCLHNKHIDLIIRSPRLKDVRLCDLQCKYDSEKNCQLNRDMAKPILGGGAWSSRMTLECNLDRMLKIRASFMANKNLCLLAPEHKTPLLEFNIHVYRDCHN